MIQLKQGDTVGIEIQMPDTNLNKLRKPGTSLAVTGNNTKVIVNGEQLSLVQELTLHVEKHAPATLEMKMFIASSDTQPFRFKGRFIIEEMEAIDE